MCLKFSSAVDRRTFEKVVGAAGGVLGGREGEGRTQAGWNGLRSLEVGFHDNSSKHSRRDEVSFFNVFFFPFVFFFIPNLSLLNVVFFFHRPFTKLYKFRYRDINRYDL